MSHGNKGAQSMWCAHFLLACALAAPGLARRTMPRATLLSLRFFLRISRLHTPRTRGVIKTLGNESNDQILQADGAKSSRNQVLRKAEVTNQNHFDLLEINKYTIKEAKHV